MPLLHKTVPSILLWEIIETEEELLSLLPHQKIYSEEVCKFKSEKRRKEWLATRVLFHTIFSPEHSICYHPTGRPFISKSKQNISISHSFPYVAIACSPQNIGIDIERITNRASLLTEKFLSPKEETFLKALKYPTIQTSSVLLWSAKESVYKTVDISSLNIKDDIQLTLNKTNILASLPAHEMKLTVSYHIMTKFVLTICTFPAIYPKE